MVDKFKQLFSSNNASTISKLATFVKYILACFSLILYGENKRKVNYIISYYAHCCRVHNPAYAHVCMNSMCNITCTIGMIVYLMCFYLFIYLIVYLISGSF